MRVLHTYCLNYNIGDYALGMGVKNLLRDTFDIELIGDTNVQGRIFDKYYINEVVNKRYDLLVIGGGGIIHGGHWPNGWFWLIEKELIKTIKIPFVVYGAGNNYFENESMPDRAIIHLNETHKHSRFFSVRNDGSYERVVDQLGFEPYEIPDPGFHVGLNSDYMRPVEQPYVVVQLANDKATQRFDDGKQEEFVRALRKTVTGLAADYMVIFAPHVLDDVMLSEEIAKGIENVKVLKFGDYAFDHSDKMIAYYKHAEFVLAMRGHGQIIPIGFNVPVVSLQNHPKHKGLMQKLGLLEYNVDVNGGNFSDTLDETVAKLRENKSDLVLEYEKINSTLIDQSREAMWQIKESIG